MSDVLKAKDVFLKVELFLLSLLGVSQVLSLSFINIFIFALICILFIISNIETTVLMLFIALPFFNLLNANVGSTSLFYIYIIIFIFKYFKYKNFKISKTKISVLFLLLFIRVFSNNIELLIKWFLLITVLVLCYKEDFLNFQLKKIVNYFSLSFIISSLFGYYMLISGMSIYTSAYVYTAEVGSTTRFAGLVGDSVFYGQVASFLISSCFVVSYYSTKNKLRYLMILIIFSFVILTYSKTGMIISLLSFVLYVLALIIKNSKNKKNIIKSVILLLFSVISLLLIINYIIKNNNSLVIKNYITRFTASDLLTGRGEVASHYLKLLKKSWKTPFLAMPQDEYFKPFSTNGVNVINRSHNIYIETVCTFGLMASLLIIIWIVKRIISSMKKNDWICSLPIMVIIASGFSLHGHFESHYYFIVCISLAFLSCKCKEVLEVSE